MNRYRIAWATPWNQRSAIAQHSSDIVFELAARGHDVVICRTEVGEPLTWPGRPAPGGVCSLEGVPDEVLRTHFDIVVAQIGNHAGYHGALPPRLESVEAVGVFHDFFLGHLAWEYSGGADGVRTLLENVYGEALSPVETYLNDLFAAHRQPLLEWLACHCVGAVAHSGHYAQRLRDACSGPVKVIPLVLELPELPSPPPASGRLMVAVIGDVNENKRIDQLILAIGASPRLRACCRIRIIGNVVSEMRAKLEKIASVAAVAPLQFTGWIPDEELVWTLRDVDAISCLRNPVLEGASASLLLAMSSGRPTLVTNHGSYAEAPEDAVLRCSPEHEARDVLRHLERLLDDPTGFTAMGRRARAHVRAHHTPASYVDALLPLLEEAIAQRPKFAARRELADTIKGFGLGKDDPATARVAAVLGELAPAL